MVVPRIYKAEDQETWRTILHEHAQKRGEQICETFLRGVDILGLSEERIPNLEDLNKILEARSGFKGVLVEGLEEGSSFYRLLAKRKFPVGNFIRDRQDLSYTPAPDIVHDIYGHLAFFTDKAYGDFCHDFGVAASRYINQPGILRQFERFFWFTVEFGLVQTPKGIRVFGAGIASSTAECAYALSGKPEVLPFDVDVIRNQEFRIDVMQPRLFCLESPEQLYQNLPELCARIEREAA